MRRGGRAGVWCVCQCHGSKGDGKRGTSPSRSRNEDRGSRAADRERVRWTRTNEARNRPGRRNGVCARRGGIDNRDGEGQKRISKPQEGMDTTVPEDQRTTRAAGGGWRWRWRPKETRWSERTSEQDNFQIPEAIGRTQEQKPETRNQTRTNATSHRTTSPVIPEDGLLLSVEEVIVLLTEESGWLVSSSSLCMFLQTGASCLWLRLRGACGMKQLAYSVSSLHLRLPQSAPAPSSLGFCRAVVELNHRHSIQAVLWIPPAPPPVPVLKGIFNWGEINLSSLMRLWSGII
jgi:hypothetical protein